MTTLSPCPDCDVAAGEPHHDGCDIERCSHCGLQRLGCDSIAHDAAFSRWTGIWPGLAESTVLECDLNTFYASGAYRSFLIKPR